MTSLITNMIDGMAAIASGRYTVYPSYIASCIKRNIKNIDGEAIIREVGIVETVGDCKYAIPVTDFNGKKYKITIEVIDDVGVRAA